MKWVLVLYMAFLLGLLEVASFAAGKFFEAKWWMYRDPAAVSGENGISYEEYLRVRDPILGWPRASERGGKYDPSGARWCLDSGADGAERWSLSLYGDSFTADWVGGDSDSWGCRIQRRTGTRVLNYGVGGYGTDQALIRYLGNESDQAELVVLAHMSADIIRNATRYRDFETHSRSMAFKPRFAIGENGRPEQIPIPKLTYDEYERFLGLTSPQLFLPHESLHPGGPSGAVRLTFPFALALIRNLGFEGFRARRGGTTRHALYYDPDHPSHALDVTTEIMLEFVRVAKERGQASLLVIFPERLDLTHFLETGEWPYQILIDRLQQRGAQPLNFGEALLSHFEDDLDAAFGSGGRGSQYHYGIDGSHLVADTIIENLNQSGEIELPLTE